MNVLGLSEALALNYLNLGFFTLLNSLWTRLAYFTFWKLRSSKSELLPPSPDPAPEESEPDEPVIQPPRVVFNGADDVDGVTKGKVTLYYDRECESDDAVTEDWELERDGRVTDWWETWESLLRLRSGETVNGWYTCQDLTVINGNVVRFWNGGLTENSSCVRVW